jgi:hypothetical protein
MDEGVMKTYARADEVFVDGRGALRARPKGGGFLLGGRAGRRLAAAASLRGSGGGGGGALVGRQRAVDAASPPR